MMNRLQLWIHLFQYLNSTKLYSISQTINSQHQKVFQYTSTKTYGLR